MPSHGDAAGDQARARAQEILRPAVRLKDAFSGECLCEYQLEEQAHEERERCSSVVMCRVFRQASGPRRGARPWQLHPTPTPLLRAWVRHPHALMYLLCQIAGMSDS